MASKQAYQQKLEAQLNEWDAKLDMWSAKADKATATARINYENELEALKAKRVAARNTLEKLGKRTDNAWEDMKDGAEQVWDDMGKAMDKVVARFS